MPLGSLLRPRVLLPAAALLLAAVGLGAFLLLRPRPRPPLPQPGSPLYEEYAEAFQLGTAALDVQLPAEAEKHLTRAIEIVPEEPAGWANRGLLYLRTGRLEQAARDLEQA